MIVVGTDCKPNGNATVANQRVATMRIPRKGERDQTQTCEATYLMRDWKTCVVLRASACVRTVGMTQLLWPVCYVTIHVKFNARAIASP